MFSMAGDTPGKPVEVDDFARRFEMRAGNLMWFLGAGASAAAGVPTAEDMIWEFKQRLYVSQRGVSLKYVSDLSNPAIRSQLQSYIDAAEKYPPSGAPDEYAALFEAAWPSESDRQTFISGKLAGAKPSFGHLALATLMRAGLTKIVWTTNFDTLIADACAKVYDSTGALTTVALDAPNLAREAFNAGRWPIEIKLHGDFRSRRLKNTNDELRQQDARLRKVLVESCGRSGLVVVGYSGRDDSVIDALNEALNLPSPFPNGFFWLHRGEEPPLKRVNELLRRIQEKGVDGGLVLIQNFDETLRDIIRLLEILDTSALDRFASDRRRWTAPPRPSGAKRFPIVRLNALPVKSAPTVCRRIVCAIGGYSEVRNAIEAANVNALVGRTRAGVLAFGSDVDLRTAFSPYEIRAFDIHPIEIRRLRYDSGERGLLREAISRALAREHDLRLIRGRTKDLLFPANSTETAWEPLKDLVGSISGTIASHPEIHWWEGIAVRLDWADEKLWLLVEPRTAFEGVTSETRAIATDFARERSVRRYNRQLNDLIDFWSRKLAKNGDELRALRVDNGVDAVFQLAADTAFSWSVTA
jgi:NAD-dependent SIR2 family protein deacetylase